MRQETVTQLPCLRQEYVLQRFPDSPDIHGMAVDQRAEAEYAETHGRLGVTVIRVKDFRYNQQSLLIK